MESWEEGWALIIALVIFWAVMPRRASRPLERLQLSFFLFLVCIE